MQSSRVAGDNWIGPLSVVEMSVRTLPRAHKYLHSSRKRGGGGLAEPSKYLYVPTYLCACAREAGPGYACRNYRNVRLWSTDAFGRMAHTTHTTLPLTTGAGRSRCDGMCVRVRVFVRISVGAAGPACMMDMHPLFPPALVGAHASGRIRQEEPQASRAGRKMESV